MTIVAEGYDLTLHDDGLVPQLTIRRGDGTMLYDAAVPEHLLLEENKVGLRNWIDVIIEADLSATILRQPN